MLIIRIVRIGGMKVDREYVLSADGGLVLGRDSTCDVCLDDRVLSRRHARIFSDRGVYFIEDLNSRNGIYVNGVRIQGIAPLRDRAQIVMGNTEIHAYRAESSSSAAPASCGDDSIGAGKEPRGTDVPLPSELLQPRRPIHPAERPASGEAIPVDEVECSVFAPARAAQGSVLFVQMFAHTPSQTEDAERMAREFDDSSQRRGFATLDLPVPRGARLTFHLLLPGLPIDDAVQHLEWRGRPGSVQFAVSVPADLAPGVVVGTARISRDSAPLGHVKFKLEVTAGNQPHVEKAVPAGVEARRYRKAFISYASADRDEVLKRVQMLRQVGVDFFQDLLDLEPGSRWERQLYRHIDDSDLFLLFWSSSARQSQWVMEELRYALQRKGPNELAAPEIQPVVIEGPPPPSPPDELAHLHFNDYFLYFIGRGK